MDDLTLTLPRILEEYLWVVRVRPATARHFRAVVDRFGRIVGVPPAQEITLATALAFRDHVLTRATATTWNNYLRHLRTLGNFAVRMRRLEDNPFAAARFLPVGRKRKKTVEGRLVQCILALLDRPALLGDDHDALQPAWFWRAVIATLHHTGVRRAQLVALRWEHIDLEHGTLFLAAEGSKTRREWLIPLLPELLADLAFLRERTAERLGGTEDLVQRQIFNVTLFNPRYRGHTMTAAQVSGFFGRLSDQLGQRISPHRFRHTFATRLLNSSHPDIRAVQHLLGHTDMRTTLEYVDVDMEHLRSLLQTRLGGTLKRL